ncbi:hypothetical protein [Meiothermus sp.]|uniref:hypothetical protein n=1 Tax=Meiothermus sp. TaxID=1955249 RepID=UPI0021DECF0A|nr:hypothetical protein [Meiothermus sp.]GIW33546.1 MAG: hypothetical protein KatS3mg072_0879 [Meiothermus sp.]
MRYPAKIAALALLLAACGGGPPSRIEPKIDPDTRVLNPQSQASLSSFALTNAPACLDYTNQNRPLCQATLIFSADNPQLQALEVGQVLVSEPTPAAPYGLLQKVKGISRAGNTVTVQTEEADLGEALEQGEAEFQKTLTPSDLQSAQALAQSVRFAGGLTSYSAQGGVRPMATLDFSFDEVLYDQDNNPSTTNDQVRVSGKVFFDVQNGFSAGVSWKKVFGVPAYPNGVYFKAAYGIKQSAEVKVSSGLGYSINKEKELASFNFTPITVFVGPVPLVFVPSLKMVVSATGQVSAGLSFGATQSLNAQACLEYKSGFNNCSSFDESFNAGLSGANTGAQVRGSLLGKADVLLYGIVGPYAKLGGYLEMDAVVPRNPVWRLSAGVEAYLGFHLGIDLEVIEFRLDYDLKVYDKNLGTIAQATPQPSSVKLSQGGVGSPQLLKPFSLCATAYDPQDGPKAVSLSSSVEGSLGSIAANANPPCLTYTFTTEGPHTITASASNSAGLNSSATLSLNVQDPPPSVQILNPKQGQGFYAGQTVLLQGSWLDPSLSTQNCANAVWKSSVAADTLPANACGTPTITLSSSTASRTLTLEVSNARGKKGSATVNVNVSPAPANYPPSALITQPAGVNPEIGSTQIALKGWVQDNENQMLTYTWKIQRLDGSGNPISGTQQNVPGGSGNIFFTSGGTDLPTVMIANLTSLYPGATCGFRFRLTLEVTDGNAGPPARPTVATQDFRLPACIN